MAFEKRTWLARIGQGLNKFIIGAKDGEGKQTLTNSPDSVTQQGDVISAENLNDLEGRIDDAFGNVDETVSADEERITANETAIAGMRMTKLWENSSTSSIFNSQTIDLGVEAQELVIEAILQNISSDYIYLRQFFHFKSLRTSQHGQGPYLCINNGQSSGVFNFATRATGIYTANGTTKVYFGNAFNNGTQNNNYCVPVAIYKVGNIYKPS